MDVLESHYIPHIHTKYRAANQVHISRNINGNIGKYLSKNYPYSGQWFFFDIDSDTSVKAEMVDDAGNPCIISKRVNNGIIVVSGIWAEGDNLDTRRSFAIPLLGLNSNSNTLIPLLQNYAQINRDVNIDKYITFSYNDSLITNAGTDNWVNSYLNNFNTKPVFSSVNLLDGTSNTPPSVTINGKEYYGNGYLMQRLADNSKGQHFETNLVDWTTIQQKLIPQVHKVIDSITIVPVFPGPADSLKELIEVNADRSDPERPLFFLASTNSLDHVNIMVEVKFSGDTSMNHAMYYYQFSKDTLDYGRIVSSMMGYEKLKNMLIYNSTDTSGIVSLAIKHNLLCDYTGLIALEPNDTIHYMVNPYDESHFTDVTENDSTLIKDYRLVQNYPNPFNPSTIIKYELPIAGNVSLKVYDILGNEVRVLVNQFKGAGKYSAIFDAKGLASGIYIYQLSNDRFVLSRKMLLLK
jgi:hypothetical protein